MADHRKQRHWTFGLIVVLSATLLSLLVAEGLTRIFMPQPLVLLRPDVWMPLEHIGWRHTPNTDTRVNTGDREVRFRTDEQGFRIGATLPAPGDKTLVALGDSFVEALQVEYEDTMTSLLENRLTVRLGTSLRVLNAGVGGWDPNQYRIELERILGVRSVDGLIVFIYLGNDIVDSHVEDYEPRRPVERHYLRVPQRLEWRELVLSIAYPINDFLETRSHLFVLFKRRLKYVLMRVGLTPYYIPDVLLRSQTSSLRWGVTASILNEIELIGERHGLQTLFVLIPSLFEVDLTEGQKTAQAIALDGKGLDLDQAHILLGAELKKLNLSVIDMTSALRAAIAQGIPEVYGRVDYHLGKGGHQLVAKTLEEPIWEMFCVKKASLPSGRVPGG
jgi:hypothetical protein